MNTTINFESPAEESFYDDAWQRYLESKRSIEEQVGDSVQKKLQCLGRVVRLNTQPTPYSKPMPKKLTKLQRIKNKAYLAGRESQEPTIKWQEERLNNIERLRNDALKQLEVANQKIKMLSGILQSIHTSAQAGANILRVQS